MSAGRMQRTVLDLFTHVTEPLAQRPDFQRPFPEGPVLDPKDAAEVGERLRPRLGGIGLLPRGRIFSAFNRNHMDEAFRVIRLLRSLDDADVENAMGFLRDHINEQMFVYATSVLMQQPRFRSVRIPPIEEILPEKFVPFPLVSQARNLERRQAAESTEPIVLSIDFTGNDLDLEHRVAYWREDIALNAHHWHWHIVYPFTWTPADGGTKDRKGELFYYMHQQMIARYDCERLSHNLSRVVSYHNWNDPIEEGYAPHLGNDISGTEYSSRPINMVLQDLPATTVTKLRTWYDRIIDSIHEGTYRQTNGPNLPYDEVTGIDKLGDMVEPADISPNLIYYGELHNTGHDLIARVHDPDERFKTEVGVMADPATAMRDPIFYRWHKFIDLLFQEYKNTLPTYTQEQLQWDGVTVQSVSVQGNTSERPDNLQTFWQDSTIELQRGINFSRATPVRIQTRHLQHEQFTYNIVVDNSSSSAVEGTVRIFIAPTRNEIRQPFTLNDQRHLYIEMDKFRVTLNPGSNTITRNSIDSNVTVPTQKNFSTLVQEAESGTESEQDQSYCSCGLPDHLIIPRGKPEGMEFHLFVMVTNAQEDRVNGGTRTGCVDAASYCGILNERYPDRKAMGFPFDRPIVLPDNRTASASWETFRTTNMNFVPITIRFRNEVVDTSGNTVLFPLT